MPNQQTLSASEYTTVPSSIELSTPSLTHEWLYDGRIFRTTLHDSNHETIDQYASRWLAIMRNAPFMSKSLFVLDISKVTFSAYGRSRSSELTHFRKDIKSFVAIVQKGYVEAHFAELVVRTMDRETANVRLRVFPSMHEALHWLNQMDNNTVTSGVTK